MGSLRPTIGGQADSSRAEDLCESGQAVESVRTPESADMRAERGFFSNIKRKVVCPVVMAIAGVTAGSCVIERPNQDKTEEVKPYPGYEHCAPLRMCGVAPEIKNGVPTAVMFDYEYTKAATESTKGPLIELTVLTQNNEVYNLASFRAQNGYNQPSFSLQGIPGPRDVIVTIDGNEIDASYPLIRGL